MTQETPLTRLNPYNPHQPFPNPEQAWEQPNGLLAIGGDLSSRRLMNAYRSGIFPWYEAGEPILWWSPNPRAVLFPHKIKIRRSLRKSMRNKGYWLSFDKAFAEVVKSCAAPRSYSEGTWITNDMFQAYCRLHDLGFAHSVEIWQDDELVGGLYGVAANAVFCGESMFSRAVDTSKMAFVALAYYTSSWGFKLIDCQLPNPHLMSMGAEQMNRRDFLRLLKGSRAPRKVSWTVNPEVDLSQWKPG